MLPCYAPGDTLIDLYTRQRAVVTPASTVHLPASPADPAASPTAPAPKVALLTRHHDA